MIDDELDDELDGAINRSVLLVRPGAPMRRWIAQMEQESLAHIGQDLNERERAALQTASGAGELDPEPSAYLIPVQDGLTVEPRVLKAIWENIFERELHSWHTEPSRWPLHRTLKMFKQWFELELCSLAIDLCSQPLQREGD